MPTITNIKTGLPALDKLAVTHVRPIEVKGTYAFRDVSPPETLNILAEFQIKHGETCGHHDASGYLTQIITEIRDPYISQAWAVNLCLHGQDM